MTTFNKFCHNYNFEVKTKQHINVQVDVSKNYLMINLDKQHGKIINVILN